MGFPKVGVRFCQVFGVHKKGFLALSYSRFLAVLSHLNVNFYQPQPQKTVLKFKISSKNQLTKLTKLKRNALKKALFFNSTISRVITTKSYDEAMQLFIFLGISSITGIILSMPLFFHVPTFE